MKRPLFFLLLFCILLQGLFLEAQTLLDGFSATNVGGGWDLPVGTTFTKTGDQLYVWEKAGKVYVNRWNSTTKTYDKQTTPVIDISPEVGNWRDMGLLGFTLDPHFEENGYIYLFYCVDRHHLMNFGTPAYSETADDYLSATIGRLTRYTTYVNEIGQRVADLSSRKILLGESKSTGIPILYESHGVGSLAFAMDGTLLASAGDASSYVNADIGSDPDTYYKQALQDSIIAPNENVGAFRSQLLNSHSGKLLRIDPATGDGIPSNPFYDPSAPRSAKSRVWALGFRNPFRFSIRPNSGSVDRNIGDVGEIFIGDVGFNSFEEVTIVKSPGVNCGWPFYEGLIFDEDFGAINLENKDEPNPLYGSGGCTQPFFTFRQLLRQANPLNSSEVYNPCNPTLPITSSNNNRFLHRPPLLDWQHGYEIARVGIFSGGVFTAAVIGTPESKVIGTPFRGNASTGGIWYTGNMFPSSYKNTLFISDYGANWMKNVKVENFEKAKRVDNFAFDFNGIVHMAENPLDGSIFCVDIGAQKVKRIAFVSNKPPVATIVADKNYGPSPLTVNFSGSTSIDPEGQPLTYTWDFGDGSALSNLTDPQHVFTALGPLPQKYVVKLTVADNEKAISVDSMVVSLNNTPPKVNIVSPIRNWFYTIGPDTSLVLRAEVSDSEHTADHLYYRWQTILRHNNHEHPGPVDTNKVTSTVISRIGCNGEPFHWIVKLAVTDEQGLTTYDSLKLFPACATTTPTIILQPSSVHSCDGSNVSLQTATNDYYIMPLQWQVSRDLGNSWSTIPGATSPTLSLKTVLADSGIRYRAVWYNNKGYTYSDVAVLSVDPIPTPPSGSDTLKFCYAASVSDLSVNGTSVKWYLQPSGGTALPVHSLLTDGITYYASQTVNGCESKTRLPIHPRVNDALHPLIVLDGSTSSGNPGSYQWSLVSGPNVPLIDSPGVASTTVRNLMAGTYRFRLSLNGGISSSDVTVQVNITDTLLKADAGFDRTIILPDSTVYLDGLASTGDIVSYQWKKINAIVPPVFTSFDSVATYVIGLTAGAHSFELAVTDRKGMVKKDTVQITVLPVPTEGVQPLLIAKDTASSNTGLTELRLNGLPTGSLLVLSLAQSNPAYSVFQPQQDRQPDPLNVYNDGTPIELGMKFRSAEDGYVTGVRFFKAQGNTGTHIGELYTVDGIRLAQATFVNETATGWQAVKFDKAVRIQKNTTYVVAYYSAGGNYSAAPDFFNNSVVEPPLTALANGIDGTNGLYSYTDNPVFPSNAYFKTNYWVDVIFTSSEPVISSEPALNWVKRSASLGKAGAGNAAIYTAMFTRGDNVTVTAGWGKGPLSGTLYAITQFDPQLNGTVSDSGALSNAILPLTVKRTNSLLIGVASDKNAVGGEGRSYNDSTRESYYQFSPAQYAAYHFTRQASSIKTYSPGLSSPGGMAAGVAALEVMGNLRLPVIADAGQNQRRLLSIPPKGDVEQTFCDTSSIKDLKAEGKGIQWYLNESGGNELSPALPLKDSTYYYASQLVNGCYSVQRFRTMTKVKTTPPPPPVGIKDNCDSTLTFSVVPYGEIRWSTGDTSSSIIVRTSDTFFVSRTVNGCTGKQARIVGKPVLLRLTANVEQPECVGDSGWVTLIPMGGAGGYVFNSTPTGFIPSGTYQYTVTDSNNCTRQLDVVIQVDRSFWTGAVDNDWHNPANWSKGVVPNAKTHVVIPLTTLQCIVSSENAEAASIQTIRGGTVRVENGMKVIVSGKCLVLPPVK